MKLKEILQEQSQRQKIKWGPVLTDWVPSRLTEFTRWLMHLISLLKGRHQPFYIIEIFDAY